MSGTSDFVPFAAATGANVTSQAAYIAEATTATGFTPGQASSADCNKAWRQGTFQAAVLASFVADTLNINVADDGNLSVAITNLTSAVTAIANTALTGFATVSFVNANFQTITNATNASNLSVGTLPAARLPASFSVGGTIGAAAFVGSGAGLTSINGGNISAGTVAAARLPFIGNLAGITVQADPGGTPSGSPGQMFFYY
jgi:hypothetical protein